MNRWPHQLRSVSQVIDAIAGDRRRVLLTVPTGGGKTLIMADLARDYLERGLRVAVYTNRKLLVAQLARVMTELGFDFGVRSAGYEPATGAAMQICSVQTENARAIKNQGGLFTAELALIDEAHIQTGNVMRRIMDWQIESGNAYVGMTATPIGLGDLYSDLIVGAVNSELRATSPPALLPCLHYGPDEPDLRDYKAELALGKDLSEPKAASAMGGKSRHLFGRVFESFEQLNPGHKPTILFAPGVGESVWFAEQFTARGIPAAHIDGEDVWIDGKLIATSQSAREEVLGRSEDGSIKVLCNRFVLREGVDCPWLAHMIFATVFGSLQTYLQSGGRGLRYHPGLERVTLQDHGGNWHRHGSLNWDRPWNLNMTANALAGMREDRLRQKIDPEPIRCPKCGMIHAVGRRGMTCACGYQFGSSKSRPVIGSDGTLRTQTGDIYPARRVEERADTLKKWTAIFWRFKSSKRPMTFRQAIGFFLHKYGYEPPRTMKWMPVRPGDVYRLIADVPMSGLRGYQPKAPTGNVAGTPSLFGG